MKVVLFGDSLLTYLHKEYIRELESSVPGSDVYNCAMGGWDSNDGVLKAPYIASLNPDAIIISLGTNDAAPWKQVPIDAFRSNIRTVLDTFKSSRIVFLLPPPINEARDTDGDRRTNAVVQEYAEAARDVCMSNGSVSVVDSWELFRPLLESGAEYHTADGVHLTDHENELLVAQLVAALTATNEA